MENNNLKRHLVQLMLSQRQASQPQQQVQIPQMPQRTVGEGLARFGAILAGQQPKEPSFADNPYMKAMVEAQAKRMFPDETGYFYVDAYGKAVPVEGVPYGAKPIQSGLTPYGQQKTEAQTQLANEQVKTLKDFNDGGNESGYGGEKLRPEANVVGVKVIDVDQTRKAAQLEGEANAQSKSIEMSDKLATGVKRLRILNKQYNEAAPTGDRTPIQQRIAGTIQSIGAKTGIIPNEKLAGLQKNKRAQAINLIRAFGEVGNLSGPEQQGAIDQISQENLTEKERRDGVKQFAEYALAGASPVALQYLLKQADIVNILNEYGIDIGQSNFSPGEPEVNSKPEIVRTGKSKVTGKRVGMTADGQVVPLE